jgi:hypothetical protein
VTDRLLAVGTLLLAGRAGLFLRFVLAGAAFVLVAAGLRQIPPRARVWGQVAASLALIGWLGGWWTGAGMAASAVVLFWLVERAPLGRARGALVVIFLAAQAAAPVLWLPSLPGYAGRVREFVAFATNLTVLRAWGYAWDRIRRPGPDPPSGRDYALFMFFFPAFVNGPLVSLDEFQRRRLPGHWDEAAGAATLDRGALVRIALGLGAAALVLPLSSVLSAAEYEAAARGGALTAWRHAIGVYLLVYLGFTAWTEAAIGLGRLAGVALPENFAAPHLSWGVADFWRRWNVTLGLWLRNYVYLPLGGARPRRGAGPRRPEWGNTAAVFAVMAAYHLLGGLKLLGTGLPGAAYAPWLFWAAMNTAGVLATRRLGPPAGGVFRRTAVRALTLAFACVGLMTAFFPPGMPLARLAAIYQRLLFLG